MEENNISRRDFFKRLGAIALTASPVVGALSSLTSCSVGETREPRLTILHTNDVHSHIDPFPDSDTKYAGQGGYARRQSFIEQVMQAESKENVLVFECGDMFQGTPYFNFFKGQLEMQLMNRMHIDAVTIGNHEFDNGVEALCDCMEIANFPFLSANYKFTDHAAVISLSHIRCSTEGAPCRCFWSWRPSRRSGSPDQLRHRRVQGAYPHSASDGKHSSSPVRSANSSSRLRTSGITMVQIPNATYGLPRIHQA